MTDMNDLLLDRTGRKQARAARLLGFAQADPPLGDPLRPDPPDPAPPDPAPPAPPPRPAGRVPAGVRQPPPTPGDFLGALIRQSRRYS